MSTVFLSRNIRNRKLALVLQVIQYTPLLSPWRGIDTALFLRRLGDTGVMFSSTSKYEQLLIATSPNVSATNL